MSPRRLAAVSAVLLTAPLFAQTVDRTVRQPVDPGVITTRQSITPAGVQSVFDGRVHGVTFGATADEVWVLTTKRLSRLDWRRNELRAAFNLDARPGLQALVYAGKAGAFAVGAVPPPSGRGPRPVKLFRWDPSGSPTPAPVALPDGALGTDLAGALAITAGPPLRALIPLTRNNALAVVDLPSARVQKVATDVAPFAVVAAADGKTAWVSNWGRPPRDNEAAETTGTARGADRVAVDRAGIALHGTVQQIDLQAGRVVRTIPAGRHPTALVLDERTGRLFVANTNDDSIGVIDLASGEVRSTWTLAPFGAAIAGIAPTALALASARGELLVACGGINAIAVLDSASGRLKGMIPSAWYPNALALSADENRLAIGTLLGAGSGSRGATDRSPAGRYVHSYRGSVSIVDLPDASQLSSYTRAVWENNRMSLPAAEPEVAGGTRQVVPLPVPNRSGDPSSIEHVVYIVKENRTYDQLFGDLPQGNGDPSLVLFGEEVTPNQRRLARTFVLLDNFYATGGNSGDGHQWLTQANESSYALWPGYTGRSYPYDGTDPLAYSRGGFIWDAAREAGRDVRVFGEFLPEHESTPMSERPKLMDEWSRSSTDFRGRWTAAPRVAGLRGFVAGDFPAYTHAIPDVVRSRIFRSHLAEWEKQGRMPHLVLVQLPCNHTEGTTPASPTPRAMVADNDLAVGEIVEALTKSRFWPRTAIFIVEDDAQDGVDHVDGHRTVALAISPYTRRGHVDSTFYSHPSLLKTIELMLGLRSLSLFDLIANDMRASFTTEPDLTPYTAVRPTQSLTEVNPDASTLKGFAWRDARASARMRFTSPDAAPTALLNQILWRSIRGPNVPYPGVRRAVFAPYSVDVDDDDR